MCLNKMLGILFLKWTHYLVLFCCYFPCRVSQMGSKTAWKLQNQRFGGKTMGDIGGQTKQMFAALCRCSSK